MKSINIFFFSGTGNAKRIALWIYELSQEKNIDCHINNIANFAPSKIESIDKEALIVFISPIHGFNYPKITLDFIRNFPKGKNKILLLNTRAGMKIGKWVTPGLTGIAFFISSLWLRNKGYKIIGQIPYDMPSNWISIHPALNEQTVQYIHRAIKIKVNNHFTRIFQGDKLFLSHKEIIQDILVTPISLLYYIIGRFIIAKTFYSTHLCDNCGICIKECPVSAIKLVDDKPFWTIKCESCMRCMNFCPKKAIETSHGLLVLIFLLYPILVGLVYKFILTGIELSGFAKFCLSNLIFFITLIVLYRVQHLLLKNKFLSKLISYTSLTYYKFWGRYKSIADKNWKDK
ncbi:MAG: EFR1 family ferrodoxin [Ferruginibacter sp.]